MAGVTIRWTIRWTSRWTFGQAGGQSGGQAGGLEGRGDKMRWIRSEPRKYVREKEPGSFLHRRLVSQSSPPPPPASCQGSISSRHQGSWRCIQNTNQINLHKISRLCNTFLSDHKSFQKWIVHLIGEFSRWLPASVNTGFPKTSSCWEPPDVELDLNLKNSDLDNCSFWKKKGKPTWQPQSPGPPQWRPVVRCWGRFGESQRWSSCPLSTSTSATPLQRKLNMPLKPNRRNLN